MNFLPKWLSWPETQTLIATFEKARVPLRFVGGAVRDALIEKQVTDVDAATPFLPEQVISLLEAANIRVIPTGIMHGTVTAIIEKRAFEITTLRKDTACDGRHAEVAFTDDWQVDAARRDFTINALYLSPSGELFDYFGGEIDLKAGRVKFIGDIKTRIEEDYLRILRFFRFYAHYGKTAPDGRAMIACAAQAEKLSTISPERIGQEIQKLFTAPKSYHAISFMDEQRVLLHVLGFILKTRAPLRRVEEMAGAFSGEISVALKFATIILSADEVIPPESLQERLKLSNVMTDDIRTLLTLASSLNANTSFATLKQWIRRFDKKLTSEAILLSWSVGNDIIDTRHPYHAMLTLVQEWQVPVFPVTGADLIGHGMSEGKTLGDALRALEDTWEASDYKMSKEELLTRL